MSNERRRATRQRSLLRGLAYLGNSPSAMNCVVRDISETGARLQFSGAVTAPDMIDLQIPAKNQTLHCRVSWRAVDEIGVRFVTQAAEPASDAELSQRVERLEAEIAQLKHLIKKLQRTAGAVTDAA